MTDDLPAPGFGRRTLYGFLSCLALGVVLAAVAFPVGLFNVDPEVEASMIQIVLPLLGESAAAGLAGGLMGAVTRWLWGTAVTGTAVTAGVGAAGVGAIITFGLLAATLVPFFQIVWILLLGAVTWWASLRADRHQD